MLGLRRRAREQLSPAERSSAQMQLRIGLSLNRCLLVAQQAAKLVECVWCASPDRSYSSWQHGEASD